MPNAVIHDQDQFFAFLAAQPLCQWLAQKQLAIASGQYDKRNHAALHAPPKNDNADLAAALSAMA